MSGVIRDFEIYDGDIDRNVVSKYNFALSLILLRLFDLVNQRRSQGFSPPRRVRAEKSPGYEVARSRPTMWAKYPKKKLVRAVSE